jgi:hypothetical protein
MADCRTAKIHENSVPTSQRTLCTSVTKTKLLILFRKIIAVFFPENHKHLNKLCGENAEFCDVKADGAYIHHWVLNGLNPLNVCDMVELIEQIPL